MTELAIIIVSYNVAALLRPCLAALDQTLADATFSYQIVVVDNASTDGSIALVQHEFPHVTLLANPTNLGFAAGNNLGLRYFGFAQDRSDIPNAVLLLNPDTVVTAGAISELYAALCTRPPSPIPHLPSPIVGPQLRYGDGSLQSTRRRFPTVGTLFWESTLLEQWWPRNPWAQLYHMNDRPADQPQRVDWLVGAALMVRGSAIQQAGHLDEGFFMYSEELEWQQRISRITGGVALYWPKATIMHYEGKSSEQNLAQRHINFNSSKLRYARLVFGPRVAWTLRQFLRVTFLLQLTIEAAKWLLGHKRLLRRRRIQEYWLVLRELSRRPL